MLPPDLAFNEHSFFYYDLVTYNNNPRITMKAPHYHNYYEIYYLMQGRCNMLIDDSIYNLIPNDLVLIPPNVIHKTTYTDNTRQRVAITFTEDYIAPCLSDILKDGCSINVFRIPNSDFVKDVFQKISIEVVNESEISKELLKCYLTELLAYVARNIKCKIEDSENSSLMNHVMDYILENYDSNITLDTLATISGYSKNYFSKLFKETVGMCYKEYITLTRLKVAENLLRTTNKSIREIAIACGFNDSNYFSTVFQNKYGIPPTKYKKVSFCLVHND